MNSIKMYLNSLGRGVRAVILALAVIFVGAGIAQAATTISTSILTNGTLGATGVSTFGGSASTTISVAGVLTTPAGAVALFLGGASTTQLTLGSSDTIKNASASSTVLSGALTTSGAFTSTGLATFLAGASTTQFTLLSGDTIKNTTASTTVLSGTISVSTTTTTGLTASGASTLASTTATSFKVGQVGTQLSRVVSGYCVVASVTVLANTAIQTGSSTPAYAECAPPAGSMPLITGDRVFVEATSSLPSYIVLQAASSTPTADGNISVEFFNLSTSTPVTTATYSFNFWAFQ